MDELLGPNRNGDRPRLPVTHYSDPRLCRYDLAGLCPYKLFPNTKQDMGSCTYEICPVPERWKRQYEQEATERDRSDTDRELVRLLERLVRDCDDRIARANRRLEQQQRTPQAALPDGPADNDATAAAAGGGDAPSGSGDDELKAIAEELEQLTSRVGELGSMGEIDKAQELTERIEELTQRKDAIERVRAMHQHQQQQNPQHQHQHHGSGKEQQLLVCDICAAYLSVNESAQRLADHFSGKMHVGFQLVRDKLREVRERGSGSDSSRYHHRSYHGGSGSDGDRFGHYGSSDRRDAGRHDGRYGDRDRDRYGDSSRGGYHGRDGGRYDDRDRDRYGGGRDRESSQRYRSDDRYYGGSSSRRYDSGSGRSSRSRSPFSERNGGVRKSSHRTRRSLSRSRSRSVGRY